jgi:hypothetical protein
MIHRFTDEMIKEKSSESIGAQAAVMRRDEIICSIAAKRTLEVSIQTKACDRDENED